MKEASPGFFDRPSVQKQNTTVSSDSGQIKVDVSSGKTLSAVTVQIEL